MEVHLSTDYHLSDILQRLTSQMLRSIVVLSEFKYEKLPIIWNDMVIDDRVSHKTQNLLVNY